MAFAGKRTSLTQFPCARAPLIQAAPTLPGSIRERGTAWLLSVSAIPTRDAGEAGRRQHTVRAGVAHIFHLAAIAVALETYGDLVGEIGCQIFHCRA